MATIEMLRPYVEQQVARLLGVERLQVDNDGDIPIRNGSAVCYARLVEAPSGPTFRVLAPVLKDVLKSPQLLEELNEINAGVHFARFFWTDSLIVCATELPADTLQPSDIANAIACVASLADDFDDPLKSKFGGQLAVEEPPPNHPVAGDATYL